MTVLIVAEVAIIAIFKGGYVLVAATNVVSRVMVETAEAERRTLADDGDSQR